MVRITWRNIFLGWIVLVWLSASGQAFSDSATIPDGENWFDHPEILCTALQKQGFRAGSWGPIAPQSPVHMCEYPPVVRPSDTAAAIVEMLATAQPPSLLTLTFQVSGIRTTQADSISIAITIPTPEAKSDAKKQMLVCIQSLYLIIGQNVPAALPAYIQREEHFLSHQRYGIASFFVTSKPKQQVFWFRLGKSP
jgi:hypothetical protein